MPRVAIFAEIIKIAAMLVKTLLKLKRIENCVAKCNLYLHFLIEQNLLISSEKMLMSVELKGYVT